VTVLVARPVVYNEPTTIALGSGRAFREVVEPGALTGALARSEVVFLRDHDPGRLLGRTSAKTLRLSDTATGLDAEVDLPDTELGRETRYLVSRGDLQGGSFAFSTRRDAWYDGADMPTRVIQEIGVLFDCSACTYPAYPATSLKIRTAPRSVAGFDRRRRLEQLAKTINGQGRAVRTQPRYGRRIDRPSWVPSKRLAVRHGCGHALASFEVAS
jgi:HK97 family phage prohead protease